MNEKKKSLLTTVPAARELRKVPGFDPLKYLRTVTRDGEKVLKLDLCYKKLWFRLACPNGRMYLNPLRITDQMAIFEARLYANREDNASLLHCIWYINRKAREYIEQEMKDNDIKPENGVYGSDVPDDLCYQWAVDYFNDPDAKEDQEQEEKFVPKPYVGGSTSKGKSSKQAKGKKGDKKAASPKKAAAKETSKKPAEDDSQISLLGVA